MEEKIYKWIADYCEGSIGKEDFGQLKGWIEEMPEHRAVFEECLQLCKNAREVNFAVQVKQEWSWKALERKLKQRSRVRMIRFFAAASILLGGIVGSALFLYENNMEKKLQVAANIDEIPGKAPVMLYMADGKSVCLDNEESLGLVEKDGTKIRKETAGNALVYKSDSVVSKSVFHAVEVPVGGEFNVILADGTQVWLNSDTELRFPSHFTGDTRDVFVKGEAFFVVQKDTEHPFIIHTDEASVYVLGTEFNLSVYPGENMITTLTRGKVEVADGMNKVDLQPGEQAVYSKGAKSINVRKVDASLYSSWVKGVFEFENMSLGEIAKQLSRWYGIVFRFEDDCADRRFTGGIKKYIPLNQSLDIIEKTTNVIFKIKEREILVKSR